MNETIDLQQCPSTAELRAFAVGDLGDADIDRIASHVCDCQPCDSALRSLDGMKDCLLKSLDGFSPDGQVSAPLPEVLLRVARDAGQTSCGEAGSDVSLDSGRRIARMLGEGTCRLG